MHVQLFVCLFVCLLVCNYSLTLFFENKCECVLSAYLFLWASEPVCLHAIMIKSVMRCPCTCFSAGRHEPLARCEISGP